MARTTKILGFSVPPAVVQEVERVSREERRTKSELSREMFRVYQSYRKQRDEDENRWVMQLIADARLEQEKNPMSAEELRAESDRLTRYGERQVKKLGIQAKDIDRLIHTSRARRKALQRSQPNCVAFPPPDSARNRERTGSRTTSNGKSSGGR